jgi:sulfonate transport system substrate-binding protein
MRWVASKAAFILAGVLVLAHTAGGAKALAAEPLRIRQAYVSEVSNWASLLFEKPGIARHFGQSYVMEPIRFKGSPPIITALATGELEIGHLAYSSFALAVENAGLTDLRIISGEFQDGVAGHYSDEFFVLKDSSIHSIEDLKGKVLATNGAGSAIDLALRAMLRKHGIDEKKDVTIVEVALPNMLSMLNEHKVDLFGSVPPFAFVPAVHQAARVLFTQRDAVGATQMNVWVARQGFIEKNRRAMVDYLEDAIRAERWYLDPAHHTEAVAIAVKVSKQPADQFDDWLFTNKDYYRDPSGRPNLAALQASIDLQKNLGFLKVTLDVNKYVDLSIVDEAVERLN